MATRDLKNCINAVISVSPAVQSAAMDGSAVDTRDADSVTAIVNTGAIAGAGDFGVKIQDSDDGSTGWADAAIDSEAPATLVADTSYRIGYRGSKRYVRVSLTKAGGTSIAAGASIVLGHLHQASPDLAITS